MVMYYNPALEHPATQDIATPRSLTRNAFAPGFRRFRGTSFRGGGIRAWARNTIGIKRAASSYERLFPNPSSCDLLEIHFRNLTCRKLLENGVIW